MSDRDKQLEDIFNKFCDFGAGIKGKGSSTVRTMDNVHFCKLFKDQKLTDKNLTTTELDIIFSKVKR